MLCKKRKLLKGPSGLIQSRAVKELHCIGGFSALLFVHFMDLLYEAHEAQGLISAN